MKKFSIVLLIFTLIGCTSKMAYNNMDWMVHWYLDDYIVLDPQQEAVFDAQFPAWQNWHRHQEIPQYITQLQSIRDDINTNQLTEARIAEHIQLGGQHWQRLLDHLGPEVAALAVKLNDHQVERLFIELESNNQEKEEEVQEYLDLSQAEQLEHEQEKFEDYLDRITGDVTEQQSQIIARYVPDFINTRSEWLAYRRRIQQAAHDVLNTRASNSDFETDLTAVMVNPDGYRSQAYLDARASNKRLAGQLVMEIFPTLSQDQKSEMLQQIDDTISDLQEIERND